MRVSRCRRRRPTRESTVFFSSAELRQPPEQVAPEQPLRQRGLARADGEVHLVRRGQLLGDLVAGVAPADHEDAAPGGRSVGAR